MKNKTLVERAKKIVNGTRRNRIRSEEELELAIAILKKEVTDAQASRVLSVSRANVVAWFGVTIKELYDKGRIKIV